MLSRQILTELRDRVAVTCPAQQQACNAGPPGIFALTNPPIRTLIADNHAVLVDAMQVLLSSLEALSNMVIGDIAAERGAARDPLSQLTDRERDVLRLTAETDR